jgi:glycosyltransferase involved in cell wall biosynthesis
MSNLWVIAPLFNEEESLESFVREWIPVLRTVTGGDFTFCLLNDGSEDGSLGILKSLAKEYPEILVIDKTNTGHSATCLLGYNKAVEAKAEWIFQIDSDGQCDPAHFKEFWMARTDGLCHYGHRQGREDGWHRRLISKVLAVLLFLVSFHWVRDPNVPYRLMHLDALKASLKRIPAGFRLIQVMLALIHDEKPGIQWHIVRFRKRPGREDSLKLFFFAREALYFIRDYSLWAWHDGDPDATGKIVRIGKILLSLFATYYIIVFLMLAFIRMQAFVEYDWIEAVHMSQVHRLLAGLPLYSAPSLDYIPVLYGPLYSYLSAAVAFFIGESYASLRFVSFVSTLGTLVFIGMLVLKMTGSKQAAWVASGLYAGMYGVVGFWFDIARVDSLFMFFTMTAVYFIWASPHKGATAITCATLAATCAVLTKQTAIVPIFALCVWCCMIKNDRARFTALLCLGSIFLSQIIAVILTDGWFLYYVYKVPSSHPILMDQLLDFVKHDLYRHLSIGFVLSFMVSYILFRKYNNKKDAFFFLFFFLAMVLASLMPRFKIGGYVNNLMPLAAALAVGCGLLLGHLRFFKLRYSLLVVILLLLFNRQLFYRPVKAFPSLDAIEATRIQLNLYRNIKGPIFAPCHAYLPVMAGKNGSASWAAMSDLWLTPGQESQSSQEDLNEALREKKFNAVVLKDYFYMQDQFPFQVLAEYYQRIDLSSVLTSEEATKSKMMLYVPRI